MRLTRKEQKSLVFTRENEDVFKHKKHTHITNSSQLSTVYFFGMISLRLTRERIENCLYIKMEDFRPAWSGQSQNTSLVLRGSTSRQTIILLAVLA